MKFENVILSLEFFNFQKEQCNFCVMKKAMVNKIKNVPMKKGKNSQFGKSIPYMVFTKNVGAGAGVKSQRIGEHHCF